MLSLAKIGFYFHKEGKNYIIRRVKINNKKQDV